MECPLIQHIDVEVHEDAVKAPCEVKDLAVRDKVPVLDFVLYSGPVQEPCLVVMQPLKPDVNYPILR